MPSLSSLADLSDCLEQMRAAADRYDAGDTRAASDIARALCSIFDDSFKSPSLMTQLALPDLTLLSTCPTQPASVTSSSQALSFTEPGALVARPHMNEFRDSSRLVPWLEWWDDEAVYNLSSGPVNRSSLAVGASTWFGGFRIAIPYMKTGELEFIALLVAGEDEAWPPSQTQLADVRQICHEVLNSPSVASLRS